MLRPAVLEPKSPELLDSLDVAKTQTLETAAREFLALVDISTCAQIAFADGERRAMLAHNAVLRWQQGWNQQMQAVVRSGLWPAAVDGPRWYVRAMNVLETAERRAGANEVLRFVVEQMPGRLVEACAAIRRQSEE